MQEPFRFFPYAVGIEMDFFFKFIKNNKKDCVKWRTFIERSKIIAKNLVRMMQLSSISESLIIDSKNGKPDPYTIYSFTFYLFFSFTFCFSFSLYYCYYFTAAEFYCSISINDRKKLLLKTNIRKPIENAHAQIFTVTPKTNNFIVCACICASVTECIYSKWQEIAECKKLVHWTQYII